MTAPATDVPLDEAPPPVLPGHPEIDLVAVQQSFADAAAIVDEGPRSRSWPGG